VTLPEIQEKIQHYLAPLRRRRGRIILIAFLVGAVLCASSFIGTPVFVATAKIHPEDASAGGDNPLFAALMPMLGSEESPNTFMKGVIASWALRNRVARDSIMFDGKKCLVADAMIQTYPPPKFNIAELLGLTPKVDYTVYENKVGYAISLLRFAVSTEEDDNSLIDAMFSAKGYELTVGLGDSYVRQLAGYYKDKKTEKAQISLHYFNQRCDSVKHVLDAAIYTMAHYQDRYKYGIFAESYIPQEEARMKVEQLEDMYKQLLISREQAIAQLLNDTPVVQVLDPPSSKVDKMGISPVILFFVGLFLGAVISMVVLLRKQLYADAMLIINNALASMGNPAEKES
jgi:hypothetical protein